MLNGIDISNYQPADVAALVPNDFCIIRAGGGAGNINALAAAQIAAARRVGVRRLGLYHFAREGWSGTSPEQEAQHFLTQWAQLAQADTLPVLDWEDDDLVHDTAWALRWLEIVAAATGKIPLLYCNLSVATSFDWSRVRALGVKLWLAFYGNDAQIDGYQIPAGPLWASLVQAGWGHPPLWQYTQHGRLPGYAGNLDLNVAYRDVWAAQEPGLLVPGVPLP